jgi:hypothetical protein
MTKQAKELSWKAVQEGKKRCSPACGGGCTQAQYERAVSDADKLVKRLGPDWCPRVWENLGWHYSVISPDGYMKVSSSIGGGYHVLFGPGKQGGRVGWGGWGKTPKAAVADARRNALAEVRELLKVLGLKMPD